VGVLSCNKFTSIPSKQRWSGKSSTNGEDVDEKALEDRKDPYLSLLNHPSITPSITLHVKRNKNAFPSHRRVFEASSCKSRECTRTYTTLQAFAEEELRQECSRFNTITERG
jgi:hypothetical protein